MYVVTLDQNVWIYQTENPDTAVQVQEKIRKSGFWMKKDIGTLLCSDEEFPGAEHFAEFFPEDIVIIEEE